MKLEINKQLLLESLNSLSEPFYIYHVANTNKYKDIRPLAFQKDGKNRVKELLGKGYSVSYLDDYSKEINAFLGPVKMKDINGLINAGFNVWSNLKNNAYLYRINLNDPINLSKIMTVDITSTPQQIDYDNKHWDKFKKNLDKYYKLSDKEFEKVKDEFFEKKKVYFDERNSYLKRLGIKKVKTLQEFRKSPFLDDWANTDKYFKKNITCGNKTQYASCIPHIQVKVSGPLKYESVEKIK
jgi:hypothetical protein